MNLGVVGLAFLAQFSFASARAQTVQSLRELSLETTRRQIKPVKVDDPYFFLLKRFENCERDGRSAPNS